MKLRAVPILQLADNVNINDNDNDNGRRVDDGTDSSSLLCFEYDTNKIQSKDFVQLLDKYKILILQSPVSFSNDGTTADIMSVDDFGKYVIDLQLQYYPYIGGAAPRTVIPLSEIATRRLPSNQRDVVFTANERYVKF
jgi:hypothetical protein